MMLLMVSCIQEEISILFSTFGLFGWVGSQGTTFMDDYSIPIRIKVSQVTGNRAEKQQKLQQNFRNKYVPQGKKDIEISIV